MKSITFLALTFCLLFTVDLTAQDLGMPDRPQVESWEIMSKSNLSVRVSDSIIYYLGFDVTYRNPNDTNEFVRQIRVLLPFIVVKSAAKSDMNFFDSAISYITDGTESALLKDYISKSDPILEIRWKEIEDQKRKTTKLDGENEVWLWDASGAWIYRKGVAIKKLMLSEPLKQLDGRLVIVGHKYSLDGASYRAHEIPHSYIVIAVRATKGGK